MNVILGCTGSVASIKVLELAKLIKQSGYNIKVVPTQNATHFVSLKDLDENEIDYFLDKDEWNEWKKRDDPVLHIDLRKWADILVISPLDANTLAKISNGLCDNLLTNVVRAWDFTDTTKSFIVAPAMNTLMYKHPFTNKQLKIVKEELNAIIIDPIEKKLVCGDIGIGAMASVGTIIETIDNEKKRIESIIKE